MVHFMFCSLLIAWSRRFWDDVLWSNGDSSFLSDISDDPLVCCLRGRVMRPVLMFHIYHHKLVTEGIGIRQLLRTYSNFSFWFQRINFCLNYVGARENFQRFRSYLIIRCRLAGADWPPWCDRNMPVWSHESSHHMIATYVSPALGYSCSFKLLAKIRVRVNWIFVGGGAKPHSCRMTWHPHYASGRPTWQMSWQMTWQENWQLAR